MTGPEDDLVQGRQLTRPCLPCGIASSAMSAFDAVDGSSTGT